MAYQNKMLTAVLENTSAVCQLKETARITWITIIAAIAAAAYKAFISNSLRYIVCFMGCSLELYPV